MYKNKEFEYDLWTDKEGRHYARIKSSGEICEIDKDTMRFLRREEKRLQREKELKRLLTTDREEDDDLKDERRRAAVFFPLSLSDNQGEDERRESSWLECVGNVEETVITQVMVQTLFDHLSPQQKEVFICVIKGGETQQAFADRNGTSSRAVRNTIERIRKKAKKLF